MRFYRKQEVVEAVQWTGLNQEQVLRWLIMEQSGVKAEFINGFCFIDQRFAVGPRDWIIAGKELRTMGDGEFRQTYEVP
jgi:hypothetical protein